MGTVCGSIYELPEFARSVIEGMRVGIRVFLSETFINGRMNTTSNTGMTPRIKHLLLRHYALDHVDGLDEQSVL